MPHHQLLPGYRPMKRKQVTLTAWTVLLALTGIGLVFLLSVDRHVARSGRRQLEAASKLGSRPEPGLVIVPGAPYFPDGSPGLMLQDRLDSALALCRAGRADRVLISGDHGQDDYDEIAVMHRYLLAHGLSSEQIICDPAGFDTYQTLVRARDVYHVRSTWITTQTYHLLRALYIGECLQLELRGIPCDTRAYPAMPLHRLREIIARFKAWLDCEVEHAGPMVGS
jgi:SanA protein